MNRVTAVVASMLLLSLSVPASHAADPKGMSGMKDMPNMKAEMGKSGTTEVHKGQGKVNGIDAKAGKVNLTHGPITTLNWPGMTMDFQVRDAAMLKGVTPGQNVEFELVAQSPGQFVISRIAPSAGKK